jgi:hypothetical protein
VDAGRIPRGSVLIVENLDRISRENPWDAIPLLCGLVNAGISVVTLSPAEVVYQRGEDLTGLILATVEFGRGHSESSVKADRMSAAWSEKKRLAREEGAIVTKRLPAWVEERNGKLVAIPSRVGVLKRMFRWAIEGHGLSLIVKRLTREGVESWGRSGVWSKAYVHKIISGRSVLGEYQPIRDGKPDGTPIGRYYPVVIDENTWHRAQAAAAQRKDKPGRVGSRVASLFSGLLRDATTQEKLLIASQTRGPKGKRVYRRVLVAAASMEGRAPSMSFPYDVFEPAILSLLKELRPADVIGEEPESESAALASELSGVDQRIRAVESELSGDGDDVPALVRVLRTLEEKRSKLARELAEARQKESNPQSAAWAEAHSLLNVATDDATRLRLRGLLRSIIAGVWVLTVPRRSHRLAAVQINFVGGARRDYFIHYRTAGFCREGGWEATSTVWNENSPIDLSEPKGAAKVRTELERMEVGRSKGRKANRRSSH